MTPVFATFVDDLRADPQTVDAADTFAEFFREVELSDNWHIRQFAKALNWILVQPRTVREKIDAILKLLELPPGPRIVSMRLLLTGWAA